MVKKIIIGFVLSILVSLAGSYLYLEYGNNGLETSWQWMLETNNQGLVLSLGALPNLLLFFVFLKRREEYKARGVMMGVILIALVVFGYKVF